MKYFILNINYNGGSEVDYWLNERGLAPIFYGQLKLTTIKEKVRVDEELKKEAGYPIGPQAYADARRFVDVFSTINREVIAFSIGNEDMYIYQQDGPLYENKVGDKKYKNDLIKCFRIKLLKKVKIKECPLVLASIKANRYIQSGTFRDLNDKKYLGNIKALEYLISGKSVEVSNYMQYLQCLSSLEFETLVAKYLEEKGLFVPAYKGGYLKNYDLFCRNIGEKVVVLNNITIQSKTSISVQVKLSLEREHKEILDRVDLFFCLNNNSAFKDNKVCDWKYMKNNILEGSTTKKWLKTNLDWVLVNKYDK